MPYNEFHFLALHLEISFIFPHLLSPTIPINLFKSNAMNMHWRVEIGLANIYRIYIGVDKFLIGAKFHFTQFAKANQLTASLTILV